MIEMKMLRIIFLFILCGLFLPGEIILAQVYKWTDETGCVHFTNDPKKIPEKFKSPTQTTESKGTGTSKSRGEVEPDIVGFRDIRWETEITSLSGMKYENTDPSYGGIRVYSRRSDKLIIGGASLQAINYGFWKGRLCSVRIFVNGFENWTQLKASLFEKFGSGGQSNRYIERYL